MCQCFLLYLLISISLINPHIYNSDGTRIVSQQCVVYEFGCDLGDADYVGYSARHPQRIAEHKYSAISKHFLENHGEKNEGQFRVLKKCHGKFDCLFHEMLLTKELMPRLSSKSYSFSAKLGNIFICCFPINELLFFLYLENIPIVFLFP